MTIQNQIFSLPRKLSRGVATTNTDKENDLPQEAKWILGWLICMAAYSLYALCNSLASLTVVNIILVGLSLAIVLYAFNNVLKYGIKIWSVTLILYFFFLAVNSLNLSELQVKKDMADIYYLVFLPLLFVGMFFAQENNMKRFSEVKTETKLLSLTFIDISALVILVLYIYLRLASLDQTGMRFISPGFEAESPDAIGASSSGSGLVSYLMWATILLIPSISNKYVRWISITTIGLCCLFFLKRGTVVKIALFFFLLYISRKKAFHISANSILVLLLIVILGLTIFAAWGDTRQKARGASDDYSISAVAESRLDNDVVLWAYTYTALNYDVLKQGYIDQEPTGQFEELTKPINRILLGDAIYNTPADDTVRDLNGFNAPTLFGPFVKELGWWSWFSIAVLGLAIRCIIQISTIVNARGVYVLLISLCALSFYSNGFSSPYIIYAIISVLAICVIDRASSLLPANTYLSTCNHHSN